METAIKEHEDLVKEYFMTCVPPSDHKFAALHGAVWSGVHLFMYQQGESRYSITVLFSL